MHLYSKTLLLAALTLNLQIKTTLAFAIDHAALTALFTRDSAGFTYTDQTTCATSCSNTCYILGDGVTWQCPGAIESSLPNPDVTETVSVMGAAAQSAAPQTWQPA